MALIRYYTPDLTSEAEHNPASDTPFCSILWHVTSSSNVVGSTSKGKCGKTDGCDVCPDMHNELSYRNPELVHWLCPLCVDNARKLSKETGSSLQLPGYFAAGICSNQYCPRTANQELNIPAGYSTVRQLVFGEIYPGR